MPWYRIRTRKGLADSHESRFCVLFPSEASARLWALDDDSVEVVPDEDGDNTAIRPPPPDQAS